MTLDDPIELAPGVLRLGARIPTSGTLSWVPRDERRALPVNVYVLLSESSALVIDTGPAILHPALAERIDAVTADRERHVLVTRNDPEAMGGVGELIPHHGVRSFYYYGGGSILEWVWDAALGEAGRGDLFDAVPIASPPVVELPGLGAIDVIHPPLAVLSTVWLYHRSSRTLFTSDAFGYLPDGAPVDGPGPLVDEVGDIDTTGALAHLGARFDWVGRINSGRLVADLHALLDPLDIATLAPSHGVVVSGATAVQTYLDVVYRALAPHAVADA
jgi:hypothetical protein